MESKKMSKENMQKSWRIEGCSEWVMAYNTQTLSKDDDHLDQDYIDNLMMMKGQGKDGKFQLQARKPDQKGTTVYSE